MNITELIKKDKELNNEVNEIIEEMLNGFRLGIIDVLNNVENN